jgi:hypothetical protein
MTTTFYSASADPENLSTWTQSAPLDPGPSSRVYTGAVQYCAHTGGDATEQTTATYQTPITGTVGGSVADTYNRMSGIPSVEIEPGNPASRTSLAVALRMGVIQRSSDGRISDVVNQGAAIKEAMSEAVEPAQVDPGTAVFSRTEDEAFSKAIGPLTQPAYDGALASMVAVVALGKGTVQGTADALARSAGLERAAALELVEAAHGHYSRVVARSLAPLGLSGASLEQAYSYMQAKHPQQLQDAIQQLTHGRNPAGFKALAVAFKIANPGPVQAIRSRGYETYMDRDTGDLMARKGSGQWINATRAMRS